MMTTINLILILASSTMIYNLNPMKIIYLLMCIGFNLFTLIYCLVGSSLFPVIILIIFIGGILIAFMIVTSILPNEPLKKNTASNITAIRLLLIVVFIVAPNQAATYKYKSIFLRNINTIIIVIIILAYFIGFIYLIYTTKITLRTFFC